MKIIYRYLGVICTSFTIISCGTSKYVSQSPDTPVVPFFKEKGEGKVSVGGLWNGSSNKVGLTTQAAYAITKNIAATISYNTQHDKEKRTVDWDFIFPSQSGDIGRFYKRKNFSIGGGYFKLIGPKQNKSLNLYGGLGFGTVDVRENDITLNNQGQPQTFKMPEHSNKVIRYYLHPSYSIMPGKVFRANFGARLTLAHLNSFTSNLPEDELDRRGWPLKSKTLFCLEPSVNIQINMAPEVAFETGFTLNVTPRIPESTRVMTDNYNPNNMNASRGIIFYTRLTFNLIKRSDK